MRVKTEVSVELEIGLNTPDVNDHSELEQTGYSKILVMSSSKPSILRDRLRTLRREIDKAMEILGDG